MATLRLAARIAGLGLVCAAMLAGLASPAGAATFSGGPITINDYACLQVGATPYPSQIAVTGMTGTVTDVNVTLTNLTHPAPNDLRMLLVGPSGQTTALLEHASDASPVTDVTVTLDDEAPEPIPAPLVSGTYQPTQAGTGTDCDDVVPLAPPAPAGPYGTALSAFDGASANGAWSLYIVDDVHGDAGDADGWSIAITTTATAQTTFSDANPFTIADKGSDECTPATPYPSSIDVAGLTAPVTDVNVTLTSVTHNYPREIRVLLVGPTGQTALLMENAGGSDVDATDVTFTLDDEATGPIPDNELPPGTYQPTVTPYECEDPGSPYPSMPSPAPSAPYGAALSAFDGSNANGTWKLYVADQKSPDSGDIEGWSLDITTAASYAATVLDDDPAGYWRFGDSANPLTDSSGKANHGTYVNGVTLGVLGALAGDPDTAATYDGVNDYGTVPDSASLHVGTSFTVEGWIKRSSVTKSHQMMVKGNAFQLVVMNAGSGSQVWLRKANVTTLARSSGGIPADGNYHYVVATIDGPGSTAKIYVDGVDQTVIVSAPQSIPDTTFPITFGTTASTSAQFDEFALYPEVLTPTQVGEHYAAGTGAIVP